MRLDHLLSMELVSTDMIDLIVPSLTSKLLESARRFSTGKSGLFGPVAQLVRALL